MTQREQTFGELIDMIAAPVTRWCRRKILLGAHRAELFNLEHFHREVKNGLDGISDSKKRLMNIEIQLRDLS